MYLHTNYSTKLYTIKPLITVSTNTLLLCSYIIYLWSHACKSSSYFMIYIHISYHNHSHIRIISNVFHHYFFFLCQT